MPKRSCVQIIQSGAGGKEVQKRLGLLRAWGRRARCWAGEARESRRAREKRAAAPRARALLSLLRLSVSQRPRRLRGLPHACARPAGVQKGCGLVFCRKVGWEQLRAPCCRCRPRRKRAGSRKRAEGRPVVCGVVAKIRGWVSSRGWRHSAGGAIRESKERRREQGARALARPPRARLSSLVSRRPRRGLCLGRCRSGFSLSQVSLSLDLPLSLSI